MKSHNTEWEKHQRPAAAAVKVNKSETIFLFSSHELSSKFCVWFFDDDITVKKGFRLIYLSAKNPLICIHES